VSLLLGLTAGGLWGAVPILAAGLGLALALVSRRDRAALLFIAVASLLLGFGLRVP
jgi:hypothetical protein